MSNQQQRSEYDGHWQRAENQEFRLNTQPNGRTLFLATESDIKPNC